MRGLFLAALALSACKGGREVFPCPAEPCPENFSCLVNLCVADDSLPAGETCNADRQCDGDLVCAAETFVCAQSCILLNRTSPECEADEFCAMRIEADGSHSGACTASECTSDNDCPNDRACTEISASVSGCVPRCEISWTPDYTDNCGGTLERPKVCQTLGINRLRMVCLDSHEMAGTEGRACQPQTNPCAPGLICFDGTCHRHCNEDNGEPCSGARNLCCSEGLGPNAFWLCRSSC